MGVVAQVSLAAPGDTPPSPLPRAFYAPRHARAARDDALQRRASLSSLE